MHQFLDLNYLKFDVGATSDISDDDSESVIDEPVGPSGLENNL